jgi:hypothetical protein
VFRFFFGGLVHVTMREKKGSLLQSRVVLTAVVGAVLVLQWYMVTGFMGSGTSPVALFPQVVGKLSVDCVGLLLGSFSPPASLIPPFHVDH